MTITGFVTRVRKRVSLVEQLMNTLPEHISHPVFSGVHIVDLFCVMFCRSLFVLFLLSFGLRILITPLVPSNSSLSPLLLWTVKDPVLTFSTVCEAEYCFTDIVWYIEALWPYFKPVIPKNLICRVKIGGFEPRVCKTKDCKIEIDCFSVKHAALRNKEKEQRLFGSKSWQCFRVGRHVYGRTVVSVSYHYKNLAKPVGLVQSIHHYHLIECNFFGSWNIWKNCHLALINNRSFTTTLFLVIFIFNKG